MNVKRLLFSVPIIVLGIFVLSFLLASRNYSKKENQVVFGSIGDASILNPVLYQDAASGDVCDQVFSGLTKYDENLVIVPDLAASWMLSQVTSIYVSEATEEELVQIAASLREALTEDKSVEEELEGVFPASDMQHVEAHRLKGILPEGSYARPCIVMVWKTAGNSFKPHLEELVGQDRLLQLRLYQVRTDPEKELDEGVMATAENVIKRLASDPVVMERVLEFTPDLSYRFYIKTIGDVDPVLLAVDALRNEDDAPIATYEVKRTFTVDHNPIYTFHLRDDVRWHDGEPFTANDVLFTYKMLMDEHTLTVRRPMFEPVRLVRVVDPLTAQVVYQYPFAPALENWGFSIIPRHAFDKDGDWKPDNDFNSSPFNRNPIGTGPFKFDEWVTDERITLVANDDYFRGKPALDKISWRIIPDNFVLKQTFLVNNLDYYAVQPHEIDLFREEGVEDERKRFELFSRLTPAYTYLGYDLRTPPFDDVRVRRALTYAVDRQALVDHILYGLGEVATGTFVPTIQWAHDPDLEPLPYDPEKARRLLAEAGWTDTDGDGILDKDGRPFSFTITTNNGNDVRMDSMVLIQRYLQEIGIDVETQPIEWSVFIQRLTERSLPAYLLGWSLSLDPDQYELWHSSQMEKGFNVGGYSNPLVDKLLEEGREELNFERRKAMYREIDRIIQEDQPYMFLYYPMATAAIPADAFVRRIVDPASGETQDKAVTMSPRGILLYDLWQWHRVGPESAQ